MSERDEATLAREETKAMLAGKIGSDGTRVGSAGGSRSMVTIPPRSWSRCSCGCKSRSTHVGLGDGLALMSGCEMRVRRWLRDVPALLKARLPSEQVAAIYDLERPYEQVLSDGDGDLG